MRNAMGLKDYFLGRRIELISPLSRSEVEERVNNSAVSTFSFTGQGVSGWCRFGILSLHWRIPLFSNGFAPIFRGRLLDDMGRTRIEARFGATRFLQLFFVFWYGILTVISVTVIAALLGYGQETGDEVLFFPMAIILAGFPIAIHALFNRNADKHFESMIEFLQDEIGVTVVA